MKEIFVDIVDQNDEVIHPRPLSRVLADGLVHQIRMVKLYIKNFDKELLVCRTVFGSLHEVDKKKATCTLFDVPLTALVHAGETYEQALLRAAQETFGLDLVDLPYYELGKLSKEDGLDCYTQVYELTYHALPDFSKTTFNDFIWEKPLHMISHFTQHQEAEKSLLLSLKLYYAGSKPVSYYS
jgi:hypothetical protein